MPRKGPVEIIQSGESGFCTQFIERKLQTFRRSTFLCITFPGVSSLQVYKRYFKYKCFGLMLMRWSPLITERFEAEEKAKTEQK